MKTSRLLFLVAAIVFVISSFRAHSASTDAMGDEFVDLLAKGDFAGAAARYDKTMQSALPEPKLRDAWHSIVKQVGRSQKRHKTRALKTGGYEFALVTCELEHAMLDVKVVFNSQGEVAGLFF